MTTTFPNKGRHPVLADDNELIVVKVPGLTASGKRPDRGGEGQRHRDG